jgi:hypothetical protein
VSAFCGTEWGWHRVLTRRRRVQGHRAIKAGLIADTYLEVQGVETKRASFGDIEGDEALRVRAAAALRVCTCM